MTRRIWQGTKISSVIKVLPIIIIQLATQFLTASDNRFPESDLVLKNMFICFVIPDFSGKSVELLPPVPPIDEWKDLFPLPEPEPPVPLEPVPAFEPPVPPLAMLI